MNKKNIYKDSSSAVQITGFILFLILSVITFQTSTIKVSSDGGYYLLNASYLLDGSGYTYGALDSQQNVQVFERGPIGPLFMAAGLYLSGGKLIGPYIIVRLFYFLSITLLVLGGIWLFEKNVGLIAGFLVIFFGFYQSRGALIHLETIYLTWMMAAVLLFWKALEAEKRKYYILSGILFGISYLTTEIPILFLPVPILSLLFIGKYRTPKTCLYVIILYLSFLTTIFPWMVYLIVNDKTYLVFGRAIGIILGLTNTASYPYTVGGGNLLFASPFYLISILWNHYLIGVSVLAPFWMAGWFWVIFKAFKFKNKSEYMLVSILIIPFTLLLISQVWTGTRQAQALIFHCFSFLTLSLLINDTSNYLSDWFRIEKNKEIVKRTVIFSILILFLGMEIFIGAYPFRRFWQKTLVSSFQKKDSFYLKVKEDVKYVRAKKISNYLFKNVDAGDSILVDNNNLMKAIAFYTKTKYPLFSLPYINYPPNIKRRHQRGRNEKPANNFCCPISIINSKTGGPRFIDAFQLLTLNKLKETIIKNNISYLISLKKKDNSIYKKINLSNPLSEKPIQGVAICSVDFNSLSHKNQINTNPYTLKTLKKFNENDIEGFKKMSEIYFNKYLKWSFKETNEFIMTGALQNCL